MPNFLPPAAYQNLLNRYTIKSCVHEAPSSVHIIALIGRVQKLMARMQIFSLLCSGIPWGCWENFTALAEPIK